ncbi:MAG: hypothetical protein WC527_03690 [Candidatus Margulisiibacteriota bacterium]
MIDEKTIQKTLGIDNAKELLEDLTAKKYVRKGEITEDFARLDSHSLKFDLSKTFSADKDRIFYFLQQAYILNTRLKERTETKKKISAFQGTFDNPLRKALLYRDPALQRYYDLADAYLNSADYENMDNFDNAIKTTKNITDSQYNTNSRKPLFWHEAIFLSATANYSKGMAIFNHAKTQKQIDAAKQCFRDAIKDLYIQYSNLNPLDSYLSEYCSRLLELCANYHEMTGEEPYYTGLDGKEHSIGMEEIRRIYEKSKESNGFWDVGFEGFVNKSTNYFGGNISKYMDYYIAAKTRINYSRYCIAVSKSSSTPDEKMRCEAESAIKETLDVVEEIRNAPRNFKARWFIYNSGLFGGARELGRATFGEGSNFVKAFGLYAALAHKTNADRHIEEKEPASALEDIEKAYEEISARRKDAGSSFYLGEWQIKKAYFSVISDYLDTLLLFGDKQHTNIANGKASEWLSDESLSFAIQKEDPRLYSKMKMISDLYKPKASAEEMPERPEPLKGLGSWDFNDLALSDIFGSRKAWSEQRTEALWTETVNNLLNTIKNPNSLYIPDKDRPLLLARSYAWLGNLLKWAKEDEMDQTTKAKILAMARDLMKQMNPEDTMSSLLNGIYPDKYADINTPSFLLPEKEDAIFALYKEALAQFRTVKNKSLYLVAEEASTMYQLANLAQGIIDDKVSSEELKAEAQEIINGKMLENAKITFAKVVMDAKLPTDEPVKNNALTGYANCAAQEVIDVLAKGKAADAFKRAEGYFDVNEENGVLSIKTLITKDGEGKDVYPTLPTNTIDTVDARLIIANALISKSFDETIKAERDRGGEVRKEVTTIVDQAEKQLLAKYNEEGISQIRKDQIANQLADIAALRLYVEMGNTTKGIKISAEQITPIIKIADESTLAPIIPLTIKTKSGEEIVVLDEFMQQKLKLALISVWIWNGATNSELAIEWTKEIKEREITNFFVEEADRVSRSYR